MILLDTDHVTVLQIPSSERRTRLLEKIAIAEPEPVTISVITGEEQMRGWLAAIAKARQTHRQVSSYRHLRDLFCFLAAFDIAPFDEMAAAKFDELRAAKVRVATLDLKIASIALTRDALLLTSNRRDFERVPGLRFANWLD